MKQEAKLSVVVIVLGDRLGGVLGDRLGGRNLARCLQALGAQRSAPAFEVIVPVDDRYEEWEGLAERFPDVRFLVAGGRRTFAELRSVGCRAASGPLVALTEDHCVPEPDWCEQVVQAHAGPHAAVGGAVEKLPSDTILNWAMYLCDYARYMNPLPEGPAASLTDCNVSYKRSALDAIAAVWETEFHENVVHAELRARGESLWFSPRIMVKQQRSVRFSAALADRYSFGRLLGGTRAAALSWRRRLLLAALTPLLPAMLVARIAGHVRRAGRQYGRFLMGLPTLLVLTSAWAFGECLGYLTGRAAGPLVPEPQSDPARSVSRAASALSTRG